MYQRDYILRVIEQIAKMIAALLGLLKEERKDTLQHQLNDLVSKFLGKDVDELLEGGFDTLKEEMQEQATGADYWDKMGKALLLCGEVNLKMQKDVPAIRFLRMAEECFVEAERTYSTYSFQRQKDLEHLKTLKMRLGM